MKKRHDVLSKKARSSLMSKIRSKNTGIELIMERALRNLGLRYTRNVHIYGKPDFAIEDKKVAVFCDGDFWHGYRIDSNPRLDVKDNRAFWMAKIRANRRRDAEVNRALSKQGWTVIRFWEHEIKTNPDKCAQKVQWQAERIW